MRRASLLTAVAMAAATPTAASAWSFETHLFIASQVLADALPDGKVSLCVKGQPSAPKIDCAREYAIPPEVWAALKAEDGAYYYGGSLGPDVYPDIVTGQMTVHPGLAEKGGWVTHQWLTYVLNEARSPQEIAFAYGFVSHAAGDIFAHTWVNQYAGDIFYLTKHASRSNEAEVRHYLLERYIAKRTPGDWAQPHGARALKAPPEFVVDRLILDPRVGDQYKLETATIHAAALYERYAQAQANAENARRQGPTSTALAADFEAEAQFYRQGAMELVAASQATAHELVDPRPRTRLFGAEGASSAYIRWIKCWGPILQTGAAKAARAACRGFDWYDGVQDRLDRWGRRSGPGTYGAALAISRTAARINANIREALVRVVHPDGARLMRVMRTGEPIADKTLDKVYAKDQGRSGLVTPEAVSSLIKAEAAVTSDGVVDPTQFAALHNSIILAKLALLDQATLNTVVRNLSPTATPPYPPTATRYSLVTEGVRSIDGNHQWQARALAYPRAKGVSPPQPQCYGERGASGESSAFRLWGDKKLREEVYLKIFKGPLNPKLDPLLASEGYAQAATREDPFPSSGDGDGCPAAAL